MELLKEISKDRLIIMVTHNPELAEKYSSRIVRLLDGKVTDDTMPYEPTDSRVTENNKAKRLKKKKGTSIRKRIEYDLYYIENWSIGLDIKIIFLTFFKGFINKNAY